MNQFSSTHSSFGVMPFWCDKSNHLGNVLNVVTDRKLPIAAIYNNDFKTSIDGFATTSGSMSMNSNLGVSRLEITGVNYNQMVYKSLPTIVGKEYIVTANVSLLGGGNVAVFADGNYTVIPTDGTGSVEFTATSTSTTIGVRSLGTTNRSYWLDDIALDDAHVIYYTADVVSYSDYFPFGMQMPNRHGSENQYVYGFNGMRKDDEIKGEGNSYDFGARIYDPRVSRWLSVDPHERNYPMTSPYVAFNNNPIFFGDPDGKDGVPKNVYEKNYLEGKNLLFPKEGKGLDFGTPYSNGEQERTYNSAFFNQLSRKEEGPGNKFQSVLTLNEGISPSKAILDIFSNPQNYALDCAETGQVMHLYATMKTMGAENFDKAMGTSLTILQSETKGVMTDKYMTQVVGQTWSIDGSNQTINVGDITKTMDNDVIGTRYALENKNAPKGSSFQYENFYKVGENEYAANPMGGTLSLNELKLKLANYTYGDKHKKGESIQEYADRVVQVVERETFVEYPSESISSEEE